MSWSALRAPLAKRKGKMRPKQAESFNLPKVSHLVGGGALKKA